MQDTLNINHPLFATLDINALRKRFSKLGFSMTDEHRLAGFWVAASRSDHTPLYDQFDGLYHNAISLGDGFQVTTDSGPIRFQSNEAIEKQLGPLPASIKAKEPVIVGIDLCYKNKQALLECLNASQLSVTSQDDSWFVIYDTGLMVDTVFRFIPDQ